MYLPFITFRPAHVLFSSVHLGQIVSQFSQAMISAISAPHHHQEALRDVLFNLTLMQNCPSQLMKEAYRWCHAVCENDSTLGDKKALLLLSLKFCFRHVVPKRHYAYLETDRIEAKFTHMNHQKLAHIVIDSGDREAFADLLQAWILYPQQLPPTVLEMCVQHLIGLQKKQPFPPRLQQLIIHTIASFGCYQVFELVGVEEFIAFLNNLCVGVEKIEDEIGWPLLLLDIIQSSNGIQHLSHRYWELLVESAASPLSFFHCWTYSPHIMACLEASEEWDKLECWIAVVWMVWPPEKGKTTEEDLEHVMLSLVHQQPGAIQKLKQRVKWWEKVSYHRRTIPESFYRICDRLEQDVL